MDRLIPIGNIGKTLTFSQLPFVAAQAFNATDHGRASALQFFGEWKKDPTVVVRKFDRVVRGGGAGVKVEVVVVRRRKSEGGQ